MDTIYIRPKPSFEQTAIALQFYFRYRGIKADIASSDIEFAANKHKYTKIVEPAKHCVNTLIFFNFKGYRPLNSFYYGDFSFEKLAWASNLDIHIYSNKRWPTHNFIGLVSYGELPYIANQYKEFVVHENTPTWIIGSMKECGCLTQEINLPTVQEYAKELGFE